MTPNTPRETYIEAAAAAKAARLELAWTATTPARFAALLAAAQTATAAAESAWQALTVADLAHPTPQPAYL